MKNYKLEVNDTIYQGLYDFDETLITNKLQKLIDIIQKQRSIFFY